MGTHAQMLANEYKNSSRAKLTEHVRTHVEVSQLSGKQFCQLSAHVLGRLDEQGVALTLHSRRLCVLHVLTECVCVCEK
jgi:hypothetical protein